MAEETTSLLAADPRTRQRTIVAGPNHIFDPTTEVSVHMADFFQTVTATNGPQPGVQHYAARKYACPEMSQRLIDKYSNAVLLASEARNDAYQEWIRHRPR